MPLNKIKGNLQLNERNFYLLNNSFILKYFLNIIFLLVLWEFYTIYLFTFFLFFQIYFLKIELPSPQNPNIKKNFNSILCFPYTHWNIVKRLVDIFLNKPEFFPTSTQRHPLWKDTFQHIYPLLKLFSITSCLFYLFSLTLFF